MMPLRKWFRCLKAKHREKDNMEQFIKDQIVYGLKYLPVNVLKSFFIPKSSDETRALRKRGFIRGVCHPNENFEQIRQANIEWIRVDIPYPFNADGSVSEGFTAFKAKVRRFADNGIKTMAVTPYPKSYIENSADIRTPEGEQKVREVSAFIAKELRGLVSALQITNEMGIPRFTIPLTMDEAAKFIGTVLEAVSPEKGDMIIGFNSAGPQADLYCRMKPYLRYCDYVGVDLYIGCFSNVVGYMWFYDALLRYLWAYTGKPVLFQEFGYIGAGAPKTKAEKKAILQLYGAKSEKDAKKNIAAFVSKLPDGMREHVEYVCSGNPDRYFNFIFKSDFVNHFYRELPKHCRIPGYPHTPEGQARFFTRIIDKFYNTDYLCGTIVYCYSDSSSCYVCGQSDCPTETRWGLVDCNGNPKPSYYAVKEAFGKIKADQSK